MAPDVHEIEDYEEIYSSSYWIWQSLLKAFYDGTDELQVFNLNQRTFTARQSGRPISEYYGKLIEIFIELDYRDKVVMKTPNNIESYRKLIQRLRVHIFLAGLGNELEQIRGKIWRKDLVPELEEVYAMVCHEDLKQKKIINSDYANTDTTTIVARNCIP